MIPGLIGYLFYFSGIVNAIPDCNEYNNKALSEIRDNGYSIIDSVTVEAGYAPCELTFDVDFLQFKICGSRLYAEMMIKDEKNEPLSDAGCYLARANGKKFLIEDVVERSDVDGRIKVDFAIDNSDVLLVYFPSYRLQVYRIKNLTRN